MIVKKTLRLHSPAPRLIPRETISYFKIQGYDFYPKTIVQVNIWAIGRDPTCWKDPEEFLPKRFAEELDWLQRTTFWVLVVWSWSKDFPRVEYGGEKCGVGFSKSFVPFWLEVAQWDEVEDLDMEEKSGLSLTIHKKLPLELVPISYHPWVLSLKLNPLIVKSYDFCLD